MYNLVAVLFLSLCAYLIVQLAKRQPSSLQLSFWVGLSLKLAAGILLGLVYTWYYEVGDTFVYAADAKKLTTLFETDIFSYLHFLWSGDASFDVFYQLHNTQVRSLFLVKALSVAYLLGSNNYWLASIYFSLLSFLGSWYVIRKIASYYPQGIRAGFISFLCVPSIVFWSSGITKESLAMAALFFLAGFFIVCMQSAKVRGWEWALVVVSIYFLWSLKYYWFALFLPSSLTTFLVYTLRKRIPRLKFAYEAAIWIGLFIVMCLGMSMVHPNFYLSRLLNVIVDNYNVYTQYSNGNAMVRLLDLEPTWSSIIVNSPRALFSGLFRPLIFEVHTLFQIEIAVENLVLLGLTVYNLRYLIRIYTSPDGLLILGMLAYILLLCLFLTLSTPNFGTLSRYRVGFSPFFFFLLLYYPLRTVNLKTFKLT